MLKAQLSNHFIQAEGDSKLIKDLKKEVRTDLQKRYTGDILAILNLSSALDPRFKSMQFLDSSDRDEVHMAEVAISLQRKKVHSIK